MSIKVVSLIWDEHQGLLSGVEKSILIRLADFGSDDGSQIYPGLTRLEKDTGYSRRTVINTLKSLETKGVIKKRNRKNKVHFITNIYSINVNLLKKWVLDSAIKKPKRGSAGDALPSAGDALPPSAGDAPNPLLQDPLLKNNNRKTVLKKIVEPKKVSETVVASLLERVNKMAKEPAGKMSAVAFEKLAMGHDVVYLEEKVMLVENSSPDNAAALFRTAVNQDYSFKKPKQTKGALQPVKIYSRSENKEWWITLTDKQKSGRFETVVKKWPYVEGYLANAHISVLNEEFSDCAWFGSVMGYLGRPEKEADISLGL